MDAPTGLAVLKYAFSGKLGIWFAWSVPLFTTLAVSEAVQGQLLVALIAAIPPTGAVIVALIALLKGQKAMHLQMNSRLDELLEAKSFASKAAGVAQEREEERARVQAAASSHAVDVNVVNKPQSPVPTTSTDERGGK